MIAMVLLLTRAELLQQRALALVRSEIGSGGRFVLRLGSFA